MYIFVIRLCIVIIFLFNYNIDFYFQNIFNLYCLAIISLFKIILEKSIFKYDKVIMKKYET